MLMIEDFKMPSERPGTAPGTETLTPNELPPLDFTKGESIVMSEKPADTPAAPTDPVDGDKIKDLMGGEPANPVPEDPAPRKKPLLRLPKPDWWHSLSKKQHILIIVAGILLLSVGSGTAAYLVMHGRKPKAVALAKPPVKKSTAPVDTRVPSALTGLLVDPSINKRPVTAVMIENSTDARPQSGLDQAGVVFEAIAEGGITRFVAFFQDNQPDYVGPVRSVRPYFEQWVLGFDAPIAHVGGSPEALANIKPWGIKDLDQFYNSGAYHRVSTRYAPHNMYTSIAALNNLETQKGFTSSTFTSFVRKKDQPYKAAAAPTGTTAPTTTDSRTPASSISLNISSQAFNVNYTYDATANNYQRKMAGQPHMVTDVNGKQTQITPKVVVALVMPYSLESDGKHSVYGTIGTGQMFVFQDGTVTPGTWSKADNNSQFVFADNAGHPLALNAGQTWITVLNTAAAVTYQ